MRKNNFTRGDPVTFPLYIQHENGYRMTLETGKVFSDSGGEHVLIRFAGKILSVLRDRIRPFDEADITTANLHRKLN